MSEWYGADNLLRSRGAWVAQSGKRLTLGFSSGHDLPVRGFKPRMGLCAGGTEPAWDSLSFPLSLCPSAAHALSLKINKLKKKISKTKLLPRSQLLS